MQAPLEDSKSPDSAALESFIAAVPPAGRQGGQSRLAQHWPDIKELRSREYSWAQIADYLKTKVGLEAKTNELALYYSRQTKRGL